jgi:hypothetical protein
MADLKRNRNAPGGLTRMFLVLIAVVGGISTTAANAATFSYDVTSVSRVQAPTIATAEVESAQLSDLREGAVSLQAQAQAQGASATSPHAVNATNNGSSPNQMNKEIQRGQAPKGIERVDRTDPNIPGSQDHVHFTGERATLNRDGTWGHGDGEVELTKKQREWLKGHGWCV